MVDLATVRLAMAQGEFFLEYLPTISLDDGRCIGAEELIRWRRPTGVVPPSEFIPLIENTPLSGLLTYWVIETVANELGDWIRANRDVHIGINVPPEILGRGGLEHVAMKAGLTDVLSQMVLEITERGVPDRLGVDAINWSRHINVALDDVTLVGGASLVTLARCHFHTIKLDKSLIDEIGPEHPAPEWLTSIGPMLASSPLRVIAEGVETEQQAATLRAANIHAAQGFYFARPMRAAALMAFHRERAIPRWTGQNRPLIDRQNRPFPPADRDE